MLNYIIKILAYISRPLKALSLFGAALFFLVFCYAIFVGNSIGKDLVIQTGEYATPFFYSVINAVIWTYLIWYSCRLLSYAKENDPGNIVPRDLLELLPRLIAYNAILMMQLCILHLQSIIDLHGWCLFALWAGMNAYYFILHKTFKAKTGKGFWYMLTALVAIGYIWFLFYILFEKMAQVPGLKGHQFWLPIEAVFFFIVQVAYVWFFISRRKKLDKSDTDEKILWFNIPAFEQPYLWSFLLISLVSAIIYLTVVFNLHFSRVVGAFGFALLGFSVLIGFFNLMHFFAIRKKINIYFFLLILAIIIGFIPNNPYNFRLFDKDPNTVYRQRPLVGNYFKSWIDQRYEQIKSAPDSGYIVYFVLSDGGASRAAYWVSTVLAKFEDSSAQYFNHKDSLSNHIFCMAGASGGNVGNATYYAILRQRSLGVIKKNLPYYAASFLRSDFLTYSFGRYLGADMARHILPWMPLKDRAAALEFAMEHGEYDTVVSHVFGMSVNEVFDTTARFPALFMNTTRVQDGCPGFVSNCRLENSSMRLDVLDSVDARKSTIHLSTGAVLGARFPYLSPAGGIGNDFFVDGGYYDNSGSGTVSEVMINIRQYLDTLTDSNKLAVLKRNLRFKVIHLKNSSLQEAAISSLHPLVNDIATPILTIAQIGNTAVYNNDVLLDDVLRNQRLGQNNTISVSLYTDIDSVDYAMDWVISEYQLDRMKKAMQVEVRKNFDNIFKDIKK